ncbi:Nuclear receptor subfamily 0 group B member 1, partial [Ophiophagus hannah]
MDRCRCCTDSQGQSSILYNILKSEEQQEQLQEESSRQQLAPQPGQGPYAPALGCSCGTQRRVALKNPQVPCKAASAVLVKTLRFVKNVPCFQELPLDEQLLLVRSCWAPLLVLGLAQDRVHFETVETTELSMLHTILTNKHCDEEQRRRRQLQLLRETQGELEQSCGNRSGSGIGSGNGKLPSAAEIQSIKGFLAKCWSLDISTKEYAYLKGTVLFNPELPGLHCVQYIQGLQQEAQQALNEHVRLIHREDQHRFAKLNVALSILGSINASVIAELFFRPIIGTVNMDDMLLEMLCAKL